MTTLCSDVIAFPESAREAPERWVLMNVFTKTALGVAPEAFTLFERLARAGETTPATLEALDERRFRVWRVARFSHLDGLLADPSRFRRDATTWGEPEDMTATQLLEALESAFIVVEDEVRYRARFAAKRSLLDRERFGNYHEQLGQQLLVVERRDPAKWWVEQKFTADVGAIRSDNLYGAVQDRFLDDYLPRRLGAGAHVLDLGCGPGVIANKIAKTGATVLGIDPNASYVELATDRAAAGARFEVRDVGKPGALDDLPSGGFDFIYMSDALLFYFVPYASNQRLDVNLLIDDIKRLLKPSGTFISLEPHAVFYLTPWFGSVDRPFTVVSEYATEPEWRVVPTLTSLVSAFTRRGFAVTAMEEVRSAGPATGLDPRAARFAERFPLWQLLEFKLLP